MARCVPAWPPGCGSACTLPRGRFSNWRGLSPWLRAGIALAPLPAFAWFLREFIRSVSGMDELERRIQLEALAVAFPLTLLLLMTLGLLQIAIELNMDDWSYRHIWPFTFVFYLAGLMRSRRRYQ